jgi:hypothetical protein
VTYVHVGGLRLARPQPVLRLVQRILLHVRLLKGVAASLVAMGLAALTLSCGGDPASPSGGEGLEVRLSPGECQAIDDLPAFQRELLRDCVLTLAEYEEAALQYKLCMEEAGFTITREWPPNEFRAFGMELLGYAPPGDQAAKAALDKSADDCQNYTRELGRFWIQRYRPSEAMLQEARNALGACLREFGAQMSEQTTTEEIVAYVRAQTSANDFGQCQERVIEEFGLPGFGG